MNNATKTLLNIRAIAKDYRMFPNKELAEKSENLSKLNRLILLWQYANNCLFEPNWEDET